MKEKTLVILIGNARGGEETWNTMYENLLKPYKIKVNLFKVEFYDNFIPEQNYSISTINQLFSDDPYNISKI